VLLPQLIPWFELGTWSIAGLGIHPFGVLVVVGILSGSWIAEWRAERTGVSGQLIAEFLFWTILIGFVSAMVLNLLIRYPERLLDPEMLFTTYPGLSSYGGFLGGTCAAACFCKKKHVSVLLLGDIWSFAFPFAWLFGRAGCFVVHDHPGIVSDFFLAVDNYELEGVPRHDLGLYEVLWGVAVIPVFLWIGRKPRPRGCFVALLAVLYAAFRFPLDFLRIPQEAGGDPRYLGLTLAQYASAVVLVLGILVAHDINRNRGTESRERRMAPSR